jgi:hypothetical protein
MRLTQMNTTIYTSARAVITDDAKRIALIKARIAQLLQAGAK